MGFGMMRCVKSKQYKTYINYYVDDIERAVYGPGCTEVAIVGVGENGKQYWLHFVADDEEWESYSFDDSRTEPADEEE